MPSMARIFPVRLRPTRHLATEGCSELNDKILNLPLQTIRHHHALFEQSADHCFSQPVLGTNMTFAVVIN